MKKLFVYALAMLALASCNSEGLVVDVQEQPEDPSRMSVEFEPIKIFGNEGSRSALYYDKTSTSGTMDFVWDVNESIGVFAYANQEHPQQMKFDLVSNTNTSSLSRYITPAQGVNTLTQNTLYVAYYPYGSFNERYTDIPIDYTGQVQRGHVDMSVYFSATSSSSDYYGTYLNSEKAASGHLSDYDYLCTAPQMTTYKKGIDFSLRRVGAISRFYIKGPAPCVYDSLIIFNPKLNFTLTAKMDASQPAASALHPETTSHQIKLEFDEPKYNNNHERINEHGFDYSMVDGVPEEPTFYRNNGGTYIPYIVAYVMMAPINFSLSDVDTQLFLFGHKKGDTSTVYYYKAVTTAKPNLPANSLYRWALNDAPTDAPIEFVETTIEDWQEAEGFNNGNGEGTGGW